MPSIGWQELAIVMVIVLLIFGTKRLPEVGRSMGKAIKGFKAETIDKGLEETVQTVETKAEKAPQETG